MLRIILALSAPFARIIPLIWLLAGHVLLHAACGVGFSSIDVPGTPFSCGGITFFERLVHIARIDFYKIYRRQRL